MRAARRRVLLAAAVVALTGGVSLVGASSASAKASDNGEASKPVATIVADAQKATASASSLRLSGSVDEDGTRTTLNLVISHGSGGGTLLQAGNRFQLVVHPPDLYMKAPASTWTALSDNTPAGKIAAQLFGGKWVRTSTTNAEFGGMAKLFDVSTFAEGKSDLSSVTKGAVADFHGLPAIPLTDAAKGTTVYVAATGTPYLLGVTSDGDSSGTVVFSHYGTAKVPRAPAHSVDLDELQKAAKGSS